MNTNTANTANISDTSDTSDTYWVLASRLPALHEKIEKFNRKAVRLGLPSGISCSVVGERVQDLGHGLVQVWTQVQITGEAPTIKGYTFVARVEHTEVGNLVWKAPGYQGEDLPVEFRDAPPTCDHCQTNRRRNDTFILREDSSRKWIRVGRNCLADFLRTSDAAAALAVFSFAEELDGFLKEEGDGGASQYYALENYVACTVRAIDVFGWVSKKAAYETNVEPTSNAARFLAGQCPQNSTSYSGWLANQPTASDYEEAAKVTSWVDALEGGSDYDSNMKVAFARGYVPSKSMGLVASSVVMYRRHLEEIAKAQLPKKASEHFGVVGYQYLRTLTLTGVRSWETQWGTTHLYMMQDEAGNKFKWFASKRCAHPHESRYLDAGDMLPFAFTLKSHGDYQGEKETVIARATACKDTSGIKWVHPTTGEIFKTRKALTTATATASC